MSRLMREVITKADRDAVHGSSWLALRFVLGMVGCAAVLCGMWGVVWLVLEKL